MTEQPDLKARVEEARRLQRFAEGESARTVYVIPPNGRFDDLRKDVSALLSRITDLEAERDEVRRVCSAHFDLEQHWNKEFHREKARAQAAESRLALADRIAEAGKPFAEALAAHDADVVSWPKSAMVPGPLATVGLPIKLGEFRTLSAALTAYEENTSSKDPATGEDDA